MHPLVTVFWKINERTCNNGNNQRNGTLRTKPLISICEKQPNDFTWEPCKKIIVQVSHIVDKPEEKKNLVNWVWSYASWTTIRWPWSRRISCKMGMNWGQYPLSSSSTSFAVNFLLPGYLTNENILKIKKVYFFCWILFAKVFMNLHLD